MNVLSLKAEHIAGTSNTQMGFLSRTTVDALKWCLQPDLFRNICNHFGQPLVDLFASHQNAHLPRFTWYSTQRAEGTNALHCDWPPGLLYTFPPLPLISWVICKIISEGAEVILIAPHWLWKPLFLDLITLSLGESLQEVYPSARGHQPSGAPVAPPDCLALEGLLLREGCYSEKVIHTIQADKKQSTIRF